MIIRSNNNKQCYHSNAMNYFKFWLPQTTHFALYFPIVYFISEDSCFFRLIFLFLHLLQVNFVCVCVCVLWIFRAEFLIVIFLFLEKKKIIFLHVFPFGTIIIHIMKNKETQTTISNRAQQLNRYAMDRYNNMRVHESI